MPCRRKRCITGSCRTKHIPQGIRDSSSSTDIAIVATIPEAHREDITPSALLPRREAPAGGSRVRRAGRRGIGSFLLHLATIAKRTTAEVRTKSDAAGLLTATPSAASRRGRVHFHIYFA
jgi:hypothetical protein